MTYDHDLRRTRRAAFAIVALNLAYGVFSIVGSQWINAIASLIWAVNAAVWISQIQCHQQTRDAARDFDRAVREWKASIAE